MYFMINIFQYHHVALNLLGTWALQQGDDRPPPQACQPFPCQPCAPEGDDRFSKPPLVDCSPLQVCHLIPCQPCAPEEDDRFSKPPLVDCSLLQVCHLIPCQPCAPKASSSLTLPCNPLPEEWRPPAFQQGDDRFTIPPLAHHQVPSLNLHVPSQSFSSYYRFSLG